MIAQLVLSILLGCVLVYAWAQYKRSPLVAGASMLAGAAGLYLVWSPEQSTAVAEFIGIGRGADLILYLWVCISLNMLLSLHLKLRVQNETLTKLARAMALKNATSLEDGLPEVVSESLETAPRLPAHAHMSTQMRGQTA
jgi:small membrane protein